MDDHYQSKEFIELCFDELSTDFSITLKGPKIMAKVDGFTTGLDRVWEFLKKNDDENN